MSVNARSNGYAQHRQCTEAQRRPPTLDVGPQPRERFLNQDANAKARRKQRVIAQPVPAS